MNYVSYIHDLWRYREIYIFLHFHTKCLFASIGIERTTPIYYLELKTRNDLGSEARDVPKSFREYMISIRGEVIFASLEGVKATQGTL
jgi:hypothetical protein